jgi:hypothetical protein
VVGEQRSSLTPERPKEPMLKMICVGWEHFAKYLSIPGRFP